VSDLDRLADLYGIEPHYFDIWGHRHDTTPETKAAMLKALGLRTGSAAEISESLHATLQRQWRRPLPPTIVATSGETIPATLTLRADVAGSAITWSVSTEMGTELGGSVVPHELDLMESTELDGICFERRRLSLPPVDESGYHTLHVVIEGEPATCRLIVCPSRCYSVADAVGEDRLWGLSLQLYGLRSDRDWGIGDFSDLARFATAASGFGASLIGVNPLHALFPTEPRHASPYSPSSREALNPLYIDVDRILAAADCPPARELVDDRAFAERREGARRSELVDYPTVSQLKLSVLEQAHACFRERELSAEDSAEAIAFRDFQKSRGMPLRRHALFETLHEHFYRGGDGVWSWRDWPEPYRNVDSPEVKAFEAAHLPRVEFYEYLQWQAERQLEDAQRRALESGMRVGLYCDLAVAVHPDGQTAWSFPETLISDVSVGAPPDELGPEGQNWGLAPLDPIGLQETAFAVFISDLRANMRHAGAVRIDHVMGLQRLFWIPRGMRGTDGAYVRYPFHDLLRIIALESQRNRCIVIGEDLGTVAEGFRDALQAAGILAYRVLLFERRDDGSFKRPEDYPAEALVTASTHDLPTVAGFHAGRDIDWRQQLGHYPDGAAAAEARTERAGVRRLLDEALGSEAASGSDPHAAPHLYLASTPSRILIVQTEDLLGELEQPNLPGTHDEHPNWRRKLSVPLSEIFERDAVRSLLRELGSSRPHRPNPAQGQP